MGIFSASKKTYVSSVVYNLAGDINDRPDYLKSVVLGNLLTQRQFSIVDTIRTSYVEGPGMRLRSYHRWAKNHYKQVGIPTDTFYGKAEIDPEAVAAEMQATFSIRAAIDWVDSGAADIVMWGRQWLRANMPAKEPLNVWRVDFIAETNEAMIVFSDGTPTVVFDPLGYDPDGRWYLYVSYSRSEQINRWTTPQLFIYKRGSGSAVLDALVVSNPVNGEYVPFIPLRHENEFISDTYKPLVYAEASKAYKKAIGGKFDELIEKVEENPDLDDIDFAYIAFGASLNTKDMASKRYIFKYLKHLLTHESVGAAGFSNWYSLQDERASRRGDFNQWVYEQTVYDEGLPVTEPPPEDRGTFTSVPSNSVIIQDKGPGNTNFKMEMKWNYMLLTTGTGLAKEDAKVGEVWTTFADSEEIEISAFTVDEVENLTIDTIEFYWQKTADSWEKITAVGLVHLNHIYNGKFVEISAAQALLDDDESGFIVPINYEVFREISLVDATQMSTQCVNIVFNCYQIVKQKWYQTGWFKVLLFIVIIVVVAMTGGFAAGGVGLLGTNAGIGIALGFSGIAATIAGVVANMVAAMILTKLITYASVAVLGEKIGMIVAAIAAFITLQIGVGLQAGTSLAASWSSLMNPMNLLHLSNSVMNGYAGMLQADTMEIMEKLGEALQDFRVQSLALQGQYAEQFGYGTAAFNPMSLTDTGQSFFTEPAETFLSRTLLTGIDIAEISNGLITNFVELTLRNPYSEE